MATKQFKIHYDHELGKGAFGQVFPATNKETGEELVVKVMLRKKLTVEDIRSVESEVVALNQLSHRNIVKLYKFIEDRCAFYLFMERVHGGELFERIVKKLVYTEAEARKVCQEILLAIEHCHSHDIVHRDIKPENLLMLSPDNDDQIKLVDFGFACKCEGDSTQLTEICGTPLYMAPEIWTKSSYGKPVDMWAFGAVVYCLMCGCLPFAGDTLEEIAAAIDAGGNEPMQFVGNEWNGVSDEAKDFISQLLTKDQRTRITAQQALNHSWVSVFSTLVICL